MLFTFIFSSTLTPFSVFLQLTTRGDYPACHYLGQFAGGKAALSNCGGVLVRMMLDNPSLLSFFLFSSYSSFSLLSPLCLLRPFFLPPQLNLLHSPQHQRGLIVTMNGSFVIEPAATPSVNHMHVIYKHTGVDRVCSDAEDVADNGIIAHEREADRDGGDGGGEGDVVASHPSSRRRRRDGPTGLK